MYAYYENIRFVILICQIIFIVFFIPISISYIYKAHKKKIQLKNLLIENINKHKFITTAVIIISILAITNMSCGILFSNTNIGSFYEKEDYIEDFYVFVSNKPFESATTIKKVPATIHSVRGGLENNSYWIKTIELNGHIIYFDPAYEIYLNSDTIVKDVNDKTYYVQLTKNKV